MSQQQQPQVMQPPYTTTAMMSSAPSTLEKFGKSAASGMATYGRIQSFIGAVVGVIIMIIMIIIGSMFIRSKYTASAPMTVVSLAAPCQPPPPPDGNSGTPKFACSVNVTFTAADGKTYTPPQPILVKWDTPLVVGSVVNLRYNPKNPTDVTQEVSPKMVGWALVGFGALIGIGSVTTAVLTQKSKSFATITGSVDAVGDMAAAFRR